MIPPATNNTNTPLKEVEAIEENEIERIVDEQRISDACTF
jgi:hypothetical protein